MDQGLGCWVHRAGFTVWLSGFRTWAKGVGSLRPIGYRTLNIRGVSLLYDVHRPHSPNE